MKRGYTSFSARTQLRVNISKEKKKRKSKREKLVERNERKPVYAYLRVLPFDRTQFYVEYFFANNRICANSNVKKKIQDN